MLSNSLLMLLINRIEKIKYHVFHKSLIKDQIFHPFHMIIKA